ncbi:MFS transporter [Streptomyces sp. NPDC004667]|uniref:MFS transporter n=1 Tax=Streptomyces sp. NPDC004667 TaxID=3154285 RepID=UPI0033B15CF3
MVSGPKYGALHRVQLGSALGALGMGLMLPYMFVYAAQVRALGAATAGGMLAVFAVAALVVLPFSARVIDRRGPCPVIVVGSVLSATGAFALGLSTTAPAVFVSVAVLGAGGAAVQPATATLLVRCSTPATRPRACATQFSVQNLGAGAGGLVGGVLAGVDHPGSFTVLLSAEALMYLAMGAVMGTVRLPGGTARPASLRADRDDGWRLLLRDRVMVRLCVLCAVMFFACYGQFESGLPAFATEAARVTPVVLGLGLMANTAVIVLTQFVLVRRVERSRRSRVMALVGGIWAAVWLVVGCSGVVHPLGAPAVVVAYALFGLGEAMLAPAVAPLVADLAPEYMVGRYNTAFTLMRQLAMTVGPVVAGMMAGAALYGAYVVLLVVCSLGMVGLALAMGRRLTPAQDSPLRSRSTGTASAPDGVSGAVADGGVQVAPT